MIVTFLETENYNMNSNSGNVTSNEWAIFLKKGMHFIYVSKNSLLSKIDKVHYIAKVTNVSIS